MLDFLARLLHEETQVLGAEIIDIMLPRLEVLGRFDLNSPLNFSLHLC
jgi:hypothetical protein